MGHISMAWLVLSRCKNKDPGKGIMWLSSDQNRSSTQLVRFLGSVNPETHLQSVLGTSAGTLCNEGE